MPAPPLNLYEMDPAYYDEYISAPIERVNFDETYRRVLEAEENAHLDVLDMCCGTGIFARLWLSRIRNVRYTGVDINDAFLDFARSHMPPGFNYQLIKADATEVKLPDSYDIVIGTSAYHHIEDRRKVAFLESMGRHLRSGGRIIIYEKFVAPFSDAVEAVKSGVTLYAERIIDMMKEHQLSDSHLFTLFNVMYLTAVRKDEYKVPYDVFAEHARTAGLEIADETKLWPPDDRFHDPKVGDFVVVLKKKN